MVLAAFCNPLPKLGACARYYGSLSMTQMAHHHFSPRLFFPPSAPLSADLRKMAGTNQSSDELFLDNSNDNMSMNKNFICGVVEGFYGRPWTTEQRRDLFAKMKKFGLNAYMYAPKDDLKHRAYWRELYTVEEAEHLTNLIQGAKDCGITFIYALSPGLDVTYSSSKEVSCLKRKLEQVSQFGCNAFALLFDDIEPDISEPDKEVFQSFGHAQVSLSNEVYQHLSQPKFIFCPTEYCTTRAVPNVQNSEYLNIIGSKLLPGIDIMWTGHKVISKTITVQSMQELSDVLKRPPLIWDNLHANDYDQKRLFLGPYCGRTPELVPHLRGVMSNPNCEYEANFIPIHTLGQWSRCKVDGKRDMTLNDSITADIKLETESETGSVEDVIPSQMGPNIYHPRKALQVAIRDWLPEFNKNKSAFGKIVASPYLPNTVIGSNSTTPAPPIPAVIVAPNCPTALVNTCMSVTLTTTSALQNLNNPEDPNYHPITTELVNSLVTPSVIPMSSTTTTIREPLLSQEGLKPPEVISPVNGTSPNSSEPMDCNPSPLGSPKHEKASGSESITDDIIDAEIEEPKISKDNDSAEDMQTEPSVPEEETQETPPLDQSKQLTYDDVALLVDLFYLPFEHGSQGLQFLQDFHWLKTNGHLVANKRAGTSAVRDENLRMARSEELDGDVETAAAVTVEEWYQRAMKFEEMTHAINRLSTRLNYVQNRSLLYDLYPYIWDIKGVISLLNSYVKWLALGRVPATSASLYICPPFTWFSKGYREAFTNGEQEPWLFRGGLTAELQRLLPLESVGDLFLYKPPDTPTSKIYTIRPYLPADEESVYHLCRKTCDDGADGSDVFPDMPNLIGDKLVGGYLCLSPEYCFVIEDEEGICGYCVAALDAKEFHRKLEMAWIPELRSKYPVNDVPNKNKLEDQSTAMLTPAEEMIAGFHNTKPFTAIPDDIYTNHPSILKLSVAPSISDPSIPKRLMACVFSALKANGSHGVFTEVTIGDKNILDIHAKLGFMEIAIPGFTNQDVFYLGRTF